MNYAKGENPLGYIYFHRRNDTGEVFYVGVGFDKNFSRSRVVSGRSNLWKNIVAKAGYTIEIIFSGYPKYWILAKEIEFIALYGRYDLNRGPLSNHTNGGELELGRKMKEHVKEILRQYWLTHSVSEETRKKRSINGMGRTPSQETRDKISQSNKGRKRGKPAWNVRSVVQKDMQGTYIKTYLSIKSVKADRFSPSCVSGCLSGKRPHHRGFLWEYGQ